MPEPARPQPAVPPRGDGEPPDLPWAAPPSGKGPREEPGPGRASPGPQEPGSEFGSRERLPFLLSPKSLSLLRINLDCITLLTKKIFIEHLICPRRRAWVEQTEIPVLMESAF